MKVLVLGAGKMVEAILTGLKKTENLSEWVIYSPSGTSASKLAGKVGCRAVADLNTVKNPDWVLVGCKPQQLKELAVTLDGKFKDSLFVSILAAVTEEDQIKILGIKDLIRIMPNIPVENNDGICLMSSTTAKGRLSSFQHVFNKLGTAMIVSEAELDELTLLTGSGPAFIYEFAKNLAASFESLTDADREKLTRTMISGSAKAMNLSKSTLSEMSEAVTSKAGVTIAVLTEWRNNNFSEFIKKGIEAGKKRTEEIKAILRS
jgi:pyrroline-5-carboxylate reductase